MSDSLPVLYLHGIFRLVSDGTPQYLGQKKSHRLLAFLCLHPHETHTRAKLSRLFWPGVADDLARKSLRAALPELHPLLGSAGHDLTIDQQAVRFDPQGVRVDVLDIRFLLSQDDPDHMAQILDRSRYGLLESFDDDWVTTYRIGYQQTLKTATVEAISRLKGYDLEHALELCHALLFRHGTDPELQQLAADLSSAHTRAVRRSLQPVA